MLVFEASYNDRYLMYKQDVLKRSRQFEPFQLKEIILNEDEKLSMFYWQKGAVSLVTVY